MSDLPDHDDAQASADNAADVSGNTRDQNFWKSLIAGLSELELQVRQSQADTPTDTLLDLRNCVLVLQRRAAELRDRIDQTFVAAIDDHGPIEVGSVRYVVGVSRTTQCTNKKLAMESLLQAVAGDLDRLSQHLVAQPFKISSARLLVPPLVYQQCFEILTKRNVDEQPTKCLVRVDTTFTKPRNSRP